MSAGLWLALAVSAAAAWPFGSRASRPAAAEAARQVDRTRAQPVGPDELAWNPLRRAAGLAEVTADWSMAPTKAIVCDGPAMTVLLDPEGHAVKVIERWNSRSMPEARSEHEIRDGRLEGASATWQGDPPTLWETATYRANRRNGPTAYLDGSGAVVSRCEYRNDAPWTGRMLQRYGVDRATWDVSYLDGKLHGAEIQLDTERGTPLRERTFRNGVLHGPSRVWYEGVLRAEEILDNGRRVSHRSWYPNGQPEWSEQYDDRMRQHGERRHWETNGVLLAVEVYDHGRQVKNP